MPVKVQVRDPVHTGVIPDGIPDMAPKSTPASSLDKPTAGATASSTTKEHNGAAMVMSPSSSTKPLLTRLDVIGDKADYLKDSITYNLFDVTFRIDMIGVSFYMQLEINSSNHHLDEQETPPRVRL